jgi:hypothetical protein
MGKTESNLYSPTTAAATARTASPSARSFMSAMDVEKLLRGSPIYSGAAAAQGLFRLRRWKEWLVVLCKVDGV